MSPTGRSIAAICIWLAISAGAAFFPPILSLWAGFGLVLFAVFVLELLVLWRRKHLECQREITNALSLGEWHNVVLKIRHQGRFTIHFELFDGYPLSCDFEGLPKFTAAPSDGWAEITYRIRPNQRGEIKFTKTELRLSGPFGLLRKKLLTGEEQTVKVYPNFKQVAKLAMLAVDNRTAHMGIHIRRRRGEGTEFFQLREYRDGDSLRQIDWKAVSRRNQLISREYREEQNQQVLFLVDCGRRMHSRDGDLTHFDQVLNAMLLLTYVALRNGDGVGVLTFSGKSDSDKWLPPIKGGSAMNSVLNAVYDLETSTAPSDFSEAASRLNARQKRRALVVLITNLRDDDSSELPKALAPLQRRHLMLVTSLREPILHKTLEKPIRDFRDALRFGAIHHYLTQRRKTHELIRGQGVQLLDVEPANLPVSLVNRYLDIKRSGAL